MVGTNQYSSGSRSSKTRNHLQQRAANAHITTGRSGCVDVCKGDFRKGDRDRMLPLRDCETAQACAVNIGGGSKPQDRSTAAGFRAASLDFVFRGVSFNQYQRLLTRGSILRAPRASTAPQGGGAKESRQGPDTWGKPPTAAPALDSLSFATHISPLSKRNSCKTIPVFVVALIVGMQKTHAQRRDTWRILLRRRPLQTHRKIRKPIHVPHLCTPFPTSASP